MGNQLLKHMKKLFLVIALGFIGISATQAQTNYLGGFGIRGGANLFNFGGSDVEENDYTNRVGFHAGIYTMMFATDRFAIEPGIYYSVKGTQNNDAVDSRAIFNYVDVPVLFRLYPSEGFNVFAGPQISFLANSKYEGDFFGSTISFEGDNTKETDLGLVFGVGYNLPKGFNVQGSYDYGMTPIFKNSDADVYNRGFKISLGYTF